MQNFFDRYPRFRETSVVGMEGNRLDWRWEAIFNRNRELFDGTRVLDLASHDGRWSMAALDAGAVHVTGIEGRESLVAAARDTFGHYGATDRSRFVCGDIVDVLARTEGATFDVVLNLGFLYHTPKHFEVFELMARVKPGTVILDTVVYPKDGATARFYAEGTGWDGAAVSDRPHTVVGVPSPDYLKLLAGCFRYRFREIEWHKLGVGDWLGLEDYFRGDRRTYVLEAT